MTLFQWVLSAALFAFLLILRRVLMSALSDLQAAVALNVSLVQQLLAAKQAVTVTGVAEADVASLAATLTAANAAAQAQLTPAPSVTAQPAA